MIDSRVEEKLAKFQADLDALNMQVKKQIASAFKGGNLFPKKEPTDGAKPIIGKNGSSEEKSVDHPKTS